MVRVLLALAAFCLIILLPGSWSPSQITRGDVPMYVLMTLGGMMETGNFLTPFWNTKLDFSKPPLFHWILLGSTKLIPNPFLALRLPAILCSAGAVLLTFAFGRLLGFSRKRSILASVLFLSCWGMFAYGRQPLLEAPLLLAVIAAFYALVRACVDERFEWLLLFGAAAGVSAMIKWGIGPLSIGIFSALYLFGSGHGRRLASRPGWVLAAAAIACLVALPYPLYLAARFPREFLRQMLAQLVTERFKEPTGLIEFLFRGVVVDFAPWCVLLIPAAAVLRGADREVRSVLAAWLLSVVVPALLIVSRSDRYIFPGLPAMALAVSLYPGEASLRKFIALAGISASLMMGTAGILLGALGFNVIPRNIIQTIGREQVMRFDNQPEAASTGYLPLYLGRRVFIVGPDDFLDWGFSGHGFVVFSGSSLESFRETAVKNDLKYEIVASWKNFHTNPRGNKILEVLRARSLTPIVVTHYLALVHR